MSCAPFNLDKLYYDSFKGGQSGDIMDFSVLIDTEPGACMIMGRYQDDEADIRAIRGNKELCEKYTGTTNKDLNCRKKTFDDLYFDDFQAGDSYDRMSFNIQASTKGLVESSDRCTPNESSNDCSAFVSGDSSSCPSGCTYIPANTSGNCTISGEYYGSNRDIYSGGSSEICDDFNLQHGEDIDPSIEDNIFNIINKSISTRAHSDINIQSRKNNNPPSSSGVLPESTRNNAETRDTSDVLGSMNIYQDDELITPDSIDPELREYLLSLSSDRLRREAVYFISGESYRIVKENNTMFVYILTDIRYTDSIINPHQITYNDVSDLQQAIDEFDGEITEILLFTVSLDSSFSDQDSGPSTFNDGDRPFMFAPGSIPSDDSLQDALSRSTVQIMTEDYNLQGVQFTRDGFGIQFTSGTESTTHTIDFESIVAEETESDSESESNSESTAFLAGLGYQNKINTLSKTSSEEENSFPPSPEEIDFSLKTNVNCEDIQLINETKCFNEYNLPIELDTGANCTTDTEIANTYGEKYDCEKYSQCLYNNGQCIDKYNKKIAKVKSHTTGDGWKNFFEVFMNISNYLLIPLIIPLFILLLSDNYLIDYLEIKNNKKIPTIVISLSLIIIYFSVILPYINREIYPTNQGIEKFNITFYFLMILLFISTPLVFLSVKSIKLTDKISGFKKIHVEKYLNIVFYSIVYSVVIFILSIGVFLGDNSKDGSEIASCYNARGKKQHCCEVTDDDWDSGLPIDCYKIYTEKTTCEEENNCKPFRECTVDKEEDNKITWPTDDNDDNDDTDDTDDTYICEIGESYDDSVNYIVNSTNSPFSSTVMSMMLILNLIFILLFILLILYDHNQLKKFGFDKEQTNGSNIHPIIIGILLFTPILHSWMIFTINANTFLPIELSLGYQFSQISWMSIPLLFYMAYLIYKDGIDYFKKLNEEIKSKMKYFVCVAIILSIISSLFLHRRYLLKYFENKKIIKVDWENEWEILFKTNKYKIGPETKILNPLFSPTASWSLGTAIIIGLLCILYKKGTDNKSMNISIIVIIIYVLISIIYQSLYEIINKKTLESNQDLLDINMSDDTYGDFKESNVWWDLDDYLKWIIPLLGSLICFAIILNTGEGLEIISDKKTTIYLLSGLVFLVTWNTTPIEYGSAYVLLKYISLFVIAISMALNIYISVVLLILLPIILLVVYGVTDSDFVYFETCKDLIDSLELPSDFSYNSAELGGLDLRMSKSLFNKLEEEIKRYSSGKELTEYINGNGRGKFLAYCLGGKGTSAATTT